MTSVDLTDPSELPKETLAIDVRKVALSVSSGSGVNQILTGVDLSVPIGAIYGLLGPSGCGKTSLLRAIIGCRPINNGVIKVFGQAADGEHGIPGSGVGYMPQELALHSDLTISEMFFYFGRVAFLNINVIRKRIRELTTLLDLPGVGDDRLIANLSGGQQRRLSFGGACIAQPRLLILDEPTVGVDPVLRSRIWNVLRQMVTGGQCTVVITTHYVEETSRADFVGFMRKGTVLCESTPAAIKNRFRVETLEEAFYLLCTQQKRHSLAVKSRYARRYTLSDKTLPPQPVSNSSEDHVAKKIGFKTNEKRNEADDGPSGVDHNSNHTGDECKPTVAEVTPGYRQFRVRESVVAAYGLGYFDSGRHLSKIDKWLIRYRALCTKYLIKIRRQPETIVAQLVLPVLVVMTFCVCIGGTPNGIRLGIVNGENCSDFDKFNRHNTTADISRIGVGSSHGSSREQCLSSLILSSISSYMFTKIDYGDIEAAWADVDRGHLWGFIIIPASFSRGVRLWTSYSQLYGKERGNDGSIAVHADLTNEMITRTAVRVLNEACLKVVAEIGVQQTMTSVQRPKTAKKTRSRRQTDVESDYDLDLETPVTTEWPLDAKTTSLNSVLKLKINPGDSGFTYETGSGPTVETVSELTHEIKSRLKFHSPIRLESPIYGEFKRSDFFGVRDFAAPGILVIIAYSISFALTAMSLLLEKSDCLIDRNHALGVTSSQIILAQLATRLVFNLLSVVIMLSVAIMLFDIPCRGSYVAAMLILGMLVFSAMSFGVFIAGICPSIFAASLVANGLLLVVFISSGVIWSLESMPYFIREVSRLLPATVPTEALRSVLVKGAGINDAIVLRAFTVSTFWIFGSFAATAFTFDFK